MLKYDQRREVLTSDIEGSRDDLLILSGIDVAREGEDWWEAQGRPEGRFRVSVVFEER